MVMSVCAWSPLRRAIDPWTLHFGQRPRPRQRMRPAPGEVWLPARAFAQPRDHYQADGPGGIFERLFGDPEGLCTEFGPVAASGSPIFSSCSGSRGKGSGRLFSRFPPQSAILGYTGAISHIMREWSPLFARSCIVTSFTFRIVWLVVKSPFRGFAAAPAFYRGPGHHGFVGEPIVDRPLWVYQGC